MEFMIIRVEEIAKKKQASMAQIAIAWMLSKDGVFSIAKFIKTYADGRSVLLVVAAPIVGTTSIENLKDIVGGVKIKLNVEEIAYLEEPYRAQPISGHA